MKTIVQKIQSFVTRQLIKTGYIKDANFTEDELNKLITSQLPQQFSFAAPGGAGKLKVSRADLTMPENAECFHLLLNCQIDINMLGKNVYSANVDASMTAKPDYNLETKSVRLIDVQLTALHFIDETFSAIQEAQQSAESLVPAPFRGLFKASIDTAVDIFSTLSNTDLKADIKSHRNDNRQDMLDFHHKDIEANLIQLLNGDGVQYSMDASRPEDKIFAEYGNKVVVENSLLWFRF